MKPIPESLGEQKQVLLNVAAWLVINSMQGEVFVSFWFFYFCLFIFLIFFFFREPNSVNYVSKMLPIFGERKLLPN